MNNAYPSTPTRIDVNSCYTTNILLYCERTRCTKTNARRKRTYADLCEVHRHNELLPFYDWFVFRNNRIIYKSMKYRGSLNLRSNTKWGLTVPIATTEVIEWNYSINCLITSVSITLVRDNIHMFDELNNRVFIMVE